MSGWNYWVLYVLVSMAELTAVGIYIQYWWPDVPTWVSAAIFFVAINAINLTNVKVYGEMEFWFSIIKVAAIISMIAFGGYLCLAAAVVRMHRWRTCGRTVDSSRMASVARSWRWR